MEEAMKREWDTWLEAYKQISSADHIPLELFNKLKSLLLQCVQKGYADVLKEAYEKIPLARRATIDDLRRTALHLAVNYCETVAVEPMLESVDPEDLLIQDENGQTALHFAILKRKPELSIRMLEISPELANTQNGKGDTPLILAASNKLEDVCIHMIKRSCVEKSLMFVQNLDKDTAFHLAVDNGLQDLCSLLIKCASADNLLLQNNDGNTVLHLAIQNNMPKLCIRMLEISPRLGNIQNKDTYTPLILATYYGLEDLCVHMIECSYVEPPFIFVQDSSQNTAFHLAASYDMRKLCSLLLEVASGNDLLLKDGNGNTSLHLALYHGNFEMAHQMLQVNHSLGKERNSVDKSPLDILAEKAPSVIRRRAQLGVIDRLIYPCIPDADLRRAWSFCKEESKMCHVTFKSPLKLWLKIKHKIFCSENRQTREKENLASTSARQPRDEENPPSTSARQPREKGNLARTMHNGLKIMHKIFWSENRQTRDEENPPSSSTVHNSLDNDEGLQKQESWLRKMFYKFVALTLVERVKKIRNKKQQYLLICDLIDKLASFEESPLFIVAELGLTEVVKKIMNENPKAIYQRRSSDNKNAVLLAAENRRCDVYELLLHHCTKKNIHSYTFGLKDDKGNNALHLVAKFNPNRRPWRMPRNTTQMHWEIKWYKYVKDSIPKHLWMATNNKGSTPEELFKEEHRDLYKSERKGELVRMTSQAFSVVAGLIATVVYNAATTIPGSNSEKGYPNFRGRPALSTFVISSFTALFFSLISLIIFLSILISPVDDLNDVLNYDICRSLSKELLGGLTTLFVSILAMLVSFCAGHYFYLKGTILFISIFVYLIGCLIISIFFFKNVYSGFLLYAVRRKPEPWYEISK